jgi:TonB family protein
LFFAFSAVAQDAPDAAADVKTPEGAEADAGAPPDSSTSLSEVVPPRLLHFEKALYPSEAEQQGLEASVVLQIEIDVDGHVAAVEVREGAGHGFDEAAVAAAKQFVFEPATRGRLPVGAKILYRYGFKLEVRPASKSAAVSQTGELRGRIVAGTPPFPVAGAEVRLRAVGGAPMTVIPSADGTWAASNLSPGDYNVEVVAAGYRSVMLVEHVDRGRATALQYTLESAVEAEIEVTVRGAALHREVAHYDLSRTELVRVPGTFGDSIHTVEALPSVARAHAFSGDLIVRGSLPSDTQIFVEGTWVPQVFHFGSLSSVVPSEMIETLDFFPSNYSVRYGRATGGLIDVGLRLTNPDGKYHGSAQVDAINARVNAEGPIPLTDGWNFMAGVRSSYVDLWLAPVLRDGDSAVNQLPRYYDYQLYVEHRLAENGAFRLGFFGAHDEYVPVDSNPDPRDWRPATNVFWHIQPQLRLPLSSALDFKVSGSVGRIRMYYEDYDDGMAQTTVILWMLRAELSLKTGAFGIARVGTDLQYAPFSVKALMDERDANGQLASRSTGSRRLKNYDLHTDYFRPAAFAEYELTPGNRVTVIAGTRFDYSNDTSRYDIAPRITARYTLVDKPISTVIKGGCGLFYQPPEVEDTLPELGFHGLRSIRAIHSMLGVEQSLTKQVTLSVEGFEKEVDRIVNGRMDGSGAFSLENSGHERVFGADVLLRYHPDEKFFGWVAYTLSRATYWTAGEQTRLFIYDQPHILNVLASYRLGRGWEVGGRFRFTSGFIYSSWYGGMLDNATGYYTPYGPMTRRRMAPFHQLDLRVEKMWKFTDVRLSAYLDLINAYNRWSPDYAVPKYDLSGFKPLSFSLPILPSIGVRAEL